MRLIAQLAGVSTSTVSRVFHEDPCVAAETVAAVRQAIQQAGVTPTLRKARTNGRTNGKHRSTGAGTIAFLVVGTAGSNTTPAFEKLLRGVSHAVNAKDLDLVLSFVSDVAQLPPRVREKQLAGVLCHGDQPTAGALAQLQALPTVWLMSNRHRPRWGDQVMPNNAVIGDIAGRYLVRRGHRRIAYLGVARQGWCMGLRSFAFAKTAEDAGAEAQCIEAPACERGADYWSGAGMASAAESIVGGLLALPQLPTGLFVSEDRLLPQVDRALRSRGIRPGADVEVISCNNEQPHYADLAAQPARIDIRPEAIGQRGVEQLLWRLGSGAEVSERVRVMVDPVLIESADSGGAVVPANGNNGNHNAHVFVAAAGDRPSAEVEAHVPGTSY